MSCASGNAMHLVFAFPLVARSACVEYQIAALEMSRLDATAEEGETNKPP